MLVQMVAAESGCLGAWSAASTFVGTLGQSQSMDVVLVMDRFRWRSNPVLFCLLELHYQHPHVFVNQQYLFTASQELVQAGSTGARQKLIHLPSIAMLSMPLLDYLLDRYRSTAIQVTNVTETFPVGLATRNQNRKLSLCRTTTGDIITERGTTAEQCARLRSGLRTLASWILAPWKTQL